MPDPEPPPADPKRGAMGPPHDSVDTPDPVLVVDGELDVATAKAFFSELVGLIRNPGSTVYLDLTGVTFFDSHAVSALIRARKIAEVRAVNLVVAPSPMVTRILRRAGLSDQFRWGARPAPDRP